MERRQFGRRESGSAGWLKIPGRPRLACKIANINHRGALLELEVPAWLPFHFQVFIESDRSLHNCEIKHQGRDRVGIHFVDAGDEPAKLRSKNDFDEWMGLDDDGRKTAKRRT